MGERCTFRWVRAAGARSVVAKGRAEFTVPRLPLETPFIEYTALRDAGEAGDGEHTHYTTTLLGARRRYDALPPIAALRAAVGAPTMFVAYKRAQHERSAGALDVFRGLSMRAPTHARLAERLLRQLVDAEREPAFYELLPLLPLCALRVLGAAHTAWLTEIATHRPALLCFVDGLLHAAPAPIGPATAADVTLAWDALAAAAPALQHAAKARKVVPRVDDDLRGAAHAWDVFRALVRAERGAALVRVEELRAAGADVDALAVLPVVAAARTGGALVRAADHIHDTHIVRLLYDAVVAGVAVRVVHAGTLHYGAALAAEPWVAGAALLSDSPAAAARLDASSGGLLVAEPLEQWAARAERPARIVVDAAHELRPERWRLLDIGPRWYGVRELFLVGDAFTPTLTVLAALGVPARRLRLAHAPWADDALERGALISTRLAAAHEWAWARMHRRAAPAPVDVVFSDAPVLEAPVRRAHTLVMASSRATCGRLGALADAAVAAGRLVRDRDTGAVGRLGDVRHRGTGAAVQRIEPGTTEYVLCGATHVGGTQALESAEAVCTSEWAVLERGARHVVLVADDTTTMRDVCFALRHACVSLTLIVRSADALEAIAARTALPPSDLAHRAALALATPVEFQEAHEWK